MCVCACMQFKDLMRGYDKFKSDTLCYHVDTKMKGAVYWVAGVLYY